MLLSALAAGARKGFDDVYGNDPIVTIAQKHLSRIEYGDLDLTHLYAPGALDEEPDH